MRPCLPLCSNKETKIEDHSYNDEHGPIGINQKQNEYYQLRPLFRALIVIVHHQTSQKCAQRALHMLRTNIPSGLSTPISFQSIEPKLDQEMFPGYNNDNDNLIATTPSSAIDFIMALESREQNAFPESRRDPSIVDERMGNPGTYTEIAQSRGYTGSQIRGLSTGWVKLAEGEEAISQVTPVVWSQRSHSGLPLPPPSPYNRRLNQKNEK